MNDVTKRFIEAYKSMGLTGYKMNKDCSVLSKQKISNIENGKNEVSLEMLLAFFETYPEVNSNFIMNGTGEMFMDKRLNEGRLKKYEPDNKFVVKFVPVSATATFVDSLYDTAYEMETMEITNTRNEEFNDDFVLFQVDGNSMEPTVKNGAMILAKRIDEGQWENASGVVVVVYGKSLVIKRIKKNSLYLDNLLILASDNSSYGELNIERREIRGMWQAVRIIDQDIV